MSMRSLYLNHRHAIRSGGVHHPWTDRDVIAQEAAYESLRTPDAIVGSMLLPSFGTREAFRAMVRRLLLTGTDHPHHLLAWWNAGRLVGGGR